MPKNAFVRKNDEFLPSFLWLSVNGCFSYAIQKRRMGRRCKRRKPPAR